jgi:RNA recognition motif-containing protein
MNDTTTPERTINTTQTIGEAYEPDEISIPSPPPPEEWSGNYLKEGLDPVLAHATKKRKKEKKKKGLENIVNSHVYVTGLPTDVTPDELAEYFSKGGILKKDPYTGSLVALKKKKRSFSYISN